MAVSDYITCPHCGKIISDVGEGEMRKDLHDIADEFKFDGQVNYDAIESKLISEGPYEIQPFIKL